MKKRLNVRPPGLNHTLMCTACECVFTESEMLKNMRKTMTWREISELTGYSGSTISRKMRQEEYIDNQKRGPI